MAENFAQQQARIQREYHERMQKLARDMEEAMNAAFADAEADMGGYTSGFRQPTYRTRIAPSRHLQVLGLEVGATKTEIKKAYRKKAMEHHPDKGGDAAKFKEVQEAYDALK